MESQHRLYFKKQIVKKLSEQKTDVPTSAANENSKNNEADEDCDLTLLGSQSYYDQVQRFPLVNTIPSNPVNSNMEKESQDDHDSTTKALLEDITNKDLTKEKSYIEDIRIDIEFESIENTEGVWHKENSSNIFPQKENDDDELISKNDKEKEPELISTLTEVIAESEMELLRKSLEADEDEIETENNNDTNDDQVKTKKRNKRSINKSYVDFLSEEEDFVWDSSSWKETGDESSSNESDEPQEKKKKVTSEDGKVGEAGLKKKKKNKRREAKNLRDRGKEYVKKDGSIVSAGSLRPNPCQGKNCGNDCNNVSEEKRKNIFDYFWGLPSQRKKDWLVGMTAKIDIKRKRSKDSGVRHNTYFYYINDGEGRRKVCKKFLVDTLGVSPKYVSYNLANASSGLSKEESRGKTVSKNKTPQSVKESAINFIKSLPALPSHYCRKDSTRLYLPTEFKNIKNLYRIYKQSKTSEGIDVVGEKIFRDIFNKDFNIGFHVPKKDKCVKCLRFEGQNEKENPEMLTHLKEKKASKDRLAFHRELSKKNNGMLCTSFDLQKVLNTPHGESMLLFYTRKYTVYNLCFYENGTRNGFCYTWGETEGKRGGNEIATIL
ncbi:uncharacterized protein [Epargyreus clarus]|uniref:uncharacterized protein n=1 Tax=Epargyreus clarus TaxID=520877 RepID=UPI003C2E03EF